MKRASALLFLSMFFAACRDEEAHKEIDELRSFVLSISEQTSDSKPVIFTSSSKGYQFASTSAGRLPVKLVNIEPNLDGHKVTIDIGNPYLTTFSGFSLRVDFGVRPPTHPSSAGKGQANDEDPKITMAQYVVDSGAWEKSLKHQTIQFTERLTSGKWTSVQFQLSPSKTEDLGHLAIRLMIDKVSMDEQP